MYNYFVVKSFSELSSNLQEILEQIEVLWALIFMKIKKSKIIVERNCHYDDGKKLKKEK